jgi:hypothetical protein
MKKIVICVITVLFLISCNLKLGISEPLQIIIKGESFALSWDDDSNKMSSNPYKATGYKIYYRPHGSFYWRLLDEIEAENKPSFEISNNVLDYGIYDIGVSSVNSSGGESRIHSSLETLRIHSVDGI